jgi:uncharacterized lipoprotein YajG
MTWNGLTTATARGLLKKSVSISVASIIMLSGCGTSIYKMSSVNDIYNIPEDCSNKKFFITYLENQLKHDQYILSSKANYEATVSTIKTKIWRIRYTCQPV